MGVIASTARAAGCAVVALGILAGPANADSQPVPKVFRIGFLANSIPLSELESGKSAHPAVTEFVEGMRALGWHDGKNMRIVWKSAENQYDRLPVLAEELARFPVDVIVAFGGGVTAAARATKTIPIVMGVFYDPIKSGLALSYSRPGRNVTGLTSRAGDAEQHNSKRLALLKEASPRITRVAFVTLWKGPGEAPLAKSFGSSPLAQVATGLGLQLSLVTFPDTGGLKAAVQDAVKQGAQALWFDDLPLLYYPEPQKVIAEEAARFRLPVVHQVLTAAAHGALMSYGTDNSVNYRRVPYFVDRILRGTNPGEIPIEQPMKVEFHVNLQAAKAIGLEIPSTVLLQADRVFQ